MERGSTIINFAAKSNDRPTRRHNCDTAGAGFKARLQLVAMQFRGASMISSETVLVAPLSAKGSEISAANFGINMVLGYERFGSQPWEKFDEIQAAVGSKVVRFPGGAETERLFDYANPNATSAVADDGSIRQLITTDAFLDYCKTTHSKATLDLPVEQLLTRGQYGTRDFNAAKTVEVRAFIAHVLDKAGPQGIATFELGNEYESYMSSKEYGRVASTLALITHQEIDKYYLQHPADAAFKPDVAVQLWGQSVGGSLSLADLASRNASVMAEFSAAEMASVTAVDSHFYYNEGANAGKPNFHTYSNISNMIGYSLSMMNAWSDASGRPMDTMFSEWNVNLNDADNYGLQQVPVLLEMFTAMVAGGVDQMDFWSTMYHATSLGNFRGELQAAGTLFQVMTHDLIGMRATDVPVASDRYDIHAFSGGGRAVVFVSSLIDTALALKLDLSKYLEHYNFASARLMQVDLSKADGSFKSLTGLSPWEEPDAPIKLTAQNIASYLTGGLFSTGLGAHETLVLQFETAATMMGSGRADTLSGDASDNRIDALASSDLVMGLSGNDQLYGSAGNDTLLGGEGMDRIWGGAGRDLLDGGAADDTLEGKASADVIHGGAGNDYLAGGDAADQLWGEAGSDGFVFRSADRGTDVVADFSSAEGDFLVYDGGSVSRASFQVEIRAVHGLGDEGVRDMLIHFGAGGPVLWSLQDAGDLSALKLLDASTGALLTLI